MVLCPHQEEAATRIAINGSRLVLCRVCWAVIDPFPHLASPRSRAHEASLVNKYVLAELISAEPGLQKLRFADSMAELFGKKPVAPRPIRLRKSRLQQGVALFFMMLLGIAISLYAFMFCYLHYPLFTEYTDPTRQFVMQFPGKPVWSGGTTGGGTDGEAVRNYGEYFEKYRIVVEKLIQSKRFGRMKDVNSQSLTQRILSSYPTATVQQRPDILNAYAVVEYMLQEQHIVTAARVIVMDGFVYEMIVIGENLSLDDSRVQRFFDSFHRLRPYTESSSIR